MLSEVKIAACATKIYLREYIHKNINRKYWGCIGVQVSELIQRIYTQIPENKTVSVNKWNRDVYLFWKFCV